MANKWEINGKSWDEASPPELLDAACYVALNRPDQAFAFASRASIRASFTGDEKTERAAEALLAVLKQ